MPKGGHVSGSRSRERGFRKRNSAREDFAREDSARDHSSVVGWLPGHLAERRSDRRRRCIEKRGHQLGGEHLCAGHRGTAASFRASRVASIVPVDPMCVWVPCACGSDCGSGRKACAITSSVQSGIERASSDLAPRCTCADLPTREIGCSTMRKVEATSSLSSEPGEVSSNLRGASGVCWAREQASPYLWRAAAHG